MNGWEHYELEKAISHSNMAQLLELFKRENKLYEKKCMDYVQHSGNLTEEGAKKMEEECLLLNQGRMKVSLAIAERLTDISRIQHEVRPKKDSTKGEQYGY